MSRAHPGAGPSLVDQHKAKIIVAIAAILIGGALYFMLRTPQLELPRNDLPTPAEDLAGATLLATKLHELAAAGQLTGEHPLVNLAGPVTSQLTKHASWMRDQHPVDITVTPPAEHAPVAPPAEDGALPAAAPLDYVVEITAGTADRRLVLQLRRIAPGVFELIDAIDRPRYAAPADPKKN
ncbi:MAG: hypothetical protein H0W72_16195 [Planctomycetes bacterium]|nr:hypothetical protein [Planctomycetota bacterium]